MVTVGFAATALFLLYFPYTQTVDPPPPKKASFSVRGASVGSVNQTHKSCISAVSKDTEAMKTEVITHTQKKRRLEIRRAASWAFVCFHVAHRQLPAPSLLCKVHVFASFNHVIVQFWSWNYRHTRITMRNAALWDLVACSFRTSRRCVSITVALGPAACFSGVYLKNLKSVSVQLTRAHCQPASLTAGTLMCSPT